jgi:hypothetical protein
MRYSKPLEGQNATATARFWTKVDKSGDCWEWTASRIDGYGQFRIGGGGSRNVKSHLVAYTWANGPVPSGMVIDHLCRNRACVNPDHMEVITPEENSTRGMVSRHKTTEVCTNGHRWDDNTLINPSGYRICKGCAAMKRATPESKTYHREYQREWRRDEQHREAARLKAREYRRKKTD